MDEEYADDVSVGGGMAAPMETTAETTEVSEGEKKLVERLNRRIAGDKRHFKKAHERMRRDMAIARRGAPKDWPESAYVANITGRHINQSVAALYAKNPKAIARRADRLDFRVWDESEQTLIQAFQMAQQAQMAPATINPMTGQPIMDPAAQQAIAIVQDFMQGMQLREQFARIGRTLEILFDYYMREQQPLDFKTSMKQVVRRAKTCGAAFVKIGFQREYGSNYDTTPAISDHRGQISHMQATADRLSSDSGDERDEQNREADAKEFELSAQSLARQQYVLIREGLVFDFPESTAVIPDARCRSLIGFVGARWLTIEHLYTPAEVKKLFGVDLKRDFHPHRADGVSRDRDAPELPFEDDEDQDDLVCVREHYDREAGLCYYLADGHKAFLKPPSAPDVYVESFWPVYALTFNEVEDDKDPFPPSDVEMMLHMQRDYNTARQGQREHRQAARPRYGTPKGLMSDEDKASFRDSEPFSVTEFNAGMDNADVGKLFQPIPVPGVDPNLYETGTLFTDIQLTVGAQEAQFGAVSKATATESSIAEGSRVASVGSNVDDLDNFLSAIARSSGQILLQEMTPEKVVEIVGPGAVWPELTLDQIAAEVFLEIEAGSTGKPNAAQEIANWERMLPFLLQMPNISPTWLARETLRRLDDRMDLTDAIAENVPAIVSLNRQSQVSPGDPSADPMAQGAEGQNNGPAPAEDRAGSNAPMGNNQV